jgi:hypothetical protein
MAKHLTSKSLWLGWFYWGKMFINNRVKLRPPARAVVISTHLPDCGAQGDFSLIEHI